MVFGREETPGSPMNKRQGVNAVPCDASPAVGDGEPSGSGPDIGRKRSLSWTGELSKASKPCSERGTELARLACLVP